MLLINLIILGVIVICLVVIIVIVVKKFPQLSQVDVSTLPEVREKKTKERIVRERLERNFISKIKKLGKKTAPVGNFLAKIFYKIFNQTLELERKYRQKMIARTPQEKEKVDTKTDDLVKAGRELLSQEEFSTAERKFIDAIAIDPKDIEAYRGLGDLYWEQGRLDEAKQTFEHVLRLNAENYDAHSHLGDIALKQGDLQKARDHYLASVKIDSQAVSHYLALAQVYQELGQPEEAFGCLEKAVGLEPNNPRNLDALIDLSIMVGKKKEAVEALHKLKEVNPENQKIKEFEKKIKALKT